MMKLLSILFFPLFVASLAADTYADLKTEQVDSSNVQAPVQVRRRRTNTLLTLLERHPIQNVQRPPSHARYTDGVEVPSLLDEATTVDVEGASDEMHRHLQESIYRVEPRFYKIHSYNKNKKDTSNKNKKNKRDKNNDSNSDSTQKSSSNNDRKKKNKKGKNGKNGKSCKGGKGGKGSRNSDKLLWEDYSYSYCYDSKSTKTKGAKNGKGGKGAKGAKDGKGGKDGKVIRRRPGRAADTAGAEGATSVPITVKVPRYSAINNYALP